MWLLVLKNWRFLAAGLAALAVVLVIHDIRATYLERDSLKELAAAQAEGLKAMRENAARSEKILADKEKKDRREIAEINRLRGDLAHAQSQPCPVVADVIRRLRLHHCAGPWSASCSQEPDGSPTISGPAEDSGRLGAGYILSLYGAMAECATRLEALQAYTKGGG